MKLLIQPGDGIGRLVQGINSAKSSVEIAIFRFDRSEIEKALAAAVTRGVRVHALIAHTNRGGEKSLRALELRLLGAGVTVARTADDLARYHGKYMIIDRRELYLLAFNFTYVDIECCRSFGVIIDNPKTVQEAVRLFEADAKRQPYTASLSTFVVSPVNARKQLAALITAARKDLLIYDPEISDPEMVRLLEERVKAGVEVKIIGRLARRSTVLAARRPLRLRLHARMIVRDQQQAFLGSQSLREGELNVRREVGIIFRDVKAVKRLAKTFQEDWALTEQSAPVCAEAETEPAAKVARKVAKAVAKEMPPIAPVLQLTIREVVGENATVDLKPEDIEETVKDAVKEAVRQVVRDVVEDAATGDALRVPARNGLRGK